MQVDGLILYDVDAEADRTEAPRPFPFMPMMDPASLPRPTTSADWAGPVIVYRAVGKYTGDQLDQLAVGGRPRPGADRLVGAASRHQVVTDEPSEAYRRHAALSLPPRMGGVVIAERHAASGTEHVRMLRKQDAGCEFFVSQVCYDLDNTRNLLVRLRPWLPRPGSGPAAGRADPGPLRVGEDPGVHDLARHRRPRLAAGRDHPAVTPSPPRTSSASQRPGLDRVLPPARPAVRGQRREPHQPQNRDRRLHRPRPGDPQPAGLNHAARTPAVAGNLAKVRYVWRQQIGSEQFGLKATIDRRPTWPYR